MDGAKSYEKPNVSACFDAVKKSAKKFLCLRSGVWYNNATGQPRSATDNKDMTMKLHMFVCNNLSYSAYASSEKEARNMILRECSVGSGSLLYIGAQ
jgi:hypothetical protein